MFHRERKREVGELDRDRDKNIYTHIERDRPRDKQRGRGTQRNSEIERESDSLLRRWGSPLLLWSFRIGQNYSVQKGYARGAKKCMQMGEQASSTRILSL